MFHPLASPNRESDLISQLCWGNVLTIKKISARRCVKGLGQRISRASSRISAPSPFSHHGRNREEIHKRRMSPQLHTSSAMELQHGMSAEGIIRCQNDKVIRKGLARLHDPTSRPRLDLLTAMSYGNGESIHWRLCPLRTACPCHASPPVILMSTSLASLAGDRKSFRSNGSSSQ